MLRGPTQKADPRVEVHAHTEETVGMPVKIYVCTLKMSTHGPTLKKTAETIQKQIDEGKSTKDYWTENTFSLLLQWPKKNPKSRLLFNFSNSESGFYQ